MKKIKIAKYIKWVKWYEYRRFSRVISSMFLLLLFLCIAVPFQFACYEEISAQEQSKAKNSTSATLSVPDPAVESGIKQAVEAFNKSDFVSAQNILKQLYAEHAELAPPRIVLAQWFAQAELGEAVRASLEMATEETPNDPEAYLLLGEISLRQRYLTAAELLLNQAAAKLQDYKVNAERKKLLQSSLLRNRISLAETRNRWDELLTVVDTAIKTEGETATLLRQKGVALFQQKKDEEAKVQFEKAYALKTEGTEQGLPADAAISQLYLLRGEKENAKISLANALSKYPKSKEVIVLSIQSRLNDDQLEEAQKLAEQLQADFPDWEPVRKLRATIALYLSDFVTAEKLFQEMILVSPTDDQAANGLALAQSEQDDPKKLQRALEYARENVRKNQQNSDYWATLGSKLDP
jgi:tetratricopeptide (TPR) repeat protein